MLADFRFYELPITKESNIRFNADYLRTGKPTTIALSDATVYDNVILPSEHMNMTSMTVVLPHTGPFGFSYVIVAADKIEESEAYRYVTAWWVDSYRQVANDQGLLEITLSRDPWHDYLKGGSKLRGRFSALPTHEAPYLPLTIAQDTLVGDKSRAIELPVIGRTDSGGSRYAFVVVTTSISLQKSSSGNNVPGFFQYGFFAYMEAGNAYNVYGIGKTGSNTKRIFSFPTIRSFINNPVGWLQHYNDTIAEKDIVDISISERCPWKPSFTTEEGYSNPLVGFYTTPETPDIDHVINPIYWIDTHTDPISGTVTEYWGLYNLNIMQAVDDIGEITLDYTGISGLIRASGQFHLKDPADNIIAVIPSNLVGIKLKVRAMLDITGMTTYVWNDALQIVYKFPEGHIPFNGSSWLEYLAKNRDYDRECMQINIDKANADAAIGAASGVASGALTGALTANPVIGVATAALNIGTTVIGRKVSIDSEKALQEAREQQYRIASNNTYNTGYGLSYVQLSALRSARIDILLPYSVGTDDALQEYVKYNGYPAVGEYDIKLGEITGFIQGFITERFIELDGGTKHYYSIPKAIMDLMNEELIKGIRIIRYIGDI